MTDLKARKIVMASLLYYGADTAIIPDCDFDQLCKEVIAGWDELSGFRRWQLGSPEELRASGYHIKTTIASWSAAHAWYELLHDHRIAIVPTQDWRFSEEKQVRWLPVTEFRNDGPIVPGTDPDPAKAQTGLSDYF